MIIPEERYGAAFKKIRQAKRVSSDAFESVTQSSISRFESGKMKLSLDKLDAALHEMHVSLCEYEYVVNDFANDDYEMALEELEEAYYKNDKQKLRDIQKRYRHERLVVLATKAHLEGLTDAEQDEIYEELEKIEVWTYFELAIASFVIEKLDSELIMDIMDVFWEKNVNYYQISQYRRKILETSHHAVLKLIKDRKKDYAKMILDVSEQELREKDMNSRLMHYFVKGYYDYQFVDKEKGKKQTQEALEIFEKMGSQILFPAYRKFYNENIK